MVRRVLPLRRLVYLQAASVTAECVLDPQHALDAGPPPHTIRLVDISNKRNGLALEEGQVFRPPLPCPAHHGRGHLARSLHRLDILLALDDPDGVFILECGQVVRHSPGGDQPGLPRPGPAVPPLLSEPLRVGAPDADQRLAFLALVDVLLHHSGAIVRVEQVGHLEPECLDHRGRRTPCEAQQQSPAVVPLSNRQALAAVVVRRALLVAVVGPESLDKALVTGHSSRSSSRKARISVSVSNP